MRSAEIISDVEQHIRSIVCLWLEHGEVNVEAFKWLCGSLLLMGDQLVGFCEFACFACRNELGGRSGHCDAVNVTGDFGDVGGVAEPTMPQRDGVFPGGQHPRAPKRTLWTEALPGS
jgi:hypothetical protein